MDINGTERQGQKWVAPLFRIRQILGSNVGDRLSQERSIQANTWIVPQSRLCSTPSISFPIRYLLVILPFDAFVCSLSY
jgi:hypothetical protein